ncbi:MAG TPA: hypothetical protein VGG72_17225 [Bryobacteraceae bacterium]
MRAIRWRLISVMLLVGWMSAFAQGVTDFKVGDWAQMNMGGKWFTVTIAGPLNAGAYTVNQGKLVLYALANAESLRHYQPTAEELHLANETTQATPNRPKGDTVGAKFGTREPSTCASRKGPINAPNAKQYFHCDNEGVFSRDYLYLVTDVVIQVANPRPFNMGLDAGASAIDKSAQVYDIRGSYTQYQCAAQSTMANAFANSHNCNKYVNTAAQGSCFRDTFGDWHCSMAAKAGSGQIQNQMSPTGY